MSSVEGLTVAFPTEGGLDCVDITGGLRRACLHVSGTIWIEIIS